MRDQAITIPPFLKKLAQEHVEHRPWVEALAFQIQQLIAEWKLNLGKPFVEHASCSFVAPCTMVGGKSAILKLGLPHTEALHEIEGLRLLKGEPTVQLLKYDKRRNAMLLERCNPGTHLNQRPDLEQDEVICTLLPEIWKAKYVDGAFRPLAEMVAQWNQETYEALDQFPDPELAKEGCRIKENLIATTSKHVLLATDLHAGNILRAQRKKWLAIDLKPYVGDPTYDLTQHLLNCTGRLEKDPRAVIHRLAKLAGLDPKRLKAWIFSRLASEHKGANQALALKVEEWW